MAETELVGETDARKWAQEFASVRHGRLAEDGFDIAGSDSTMLGWFANAIEAGRDAGTRASDAEWTEILDHAQFFELHPGDVLVIHFDRYLTASEAHQIVDRLKVLAPDNKVVIFDGLATSIDINGDEG